MQVRKLPHHLEVAHLNSRQHAVTDPSRFGTLAHVGAIACELRRIEVAMGVDPHGHGPIMPHGLCIAQQTVIPCVCPFLPLFS